MAAPFTYSFLDTHASIVGPGGSINIGAGAGVAEEGVSFEPNEDLDAMTIGADGSGMHSLIANRAGKFTVRLLKASPTNALLQAMLNFQRTASANHGQNTLSIVNTASGDALTGQQTAFAKQPAITYTKVGEMLEWEFNSVNVDVGLGAGVQA